VDAANHRNVLTDSWGDTVSRIIYFVLGMLVLGAAPGPTEAANLVITNGNRVSIEVTARREERGRDSRVYLGRIGGRETRTFRLERGEWHLTATNRFGQVERKTVQLTRRDTDRVRFDERRDDDRGRRGRDGGWR
jgi:hypothetical protein